MKKSIITVFAIFIFLSIAVAAFATVTPTLNIQGTHGSYVWRPEYSAPTVSIGMQTNETASADWWLLCLAPSGWKYYHPTYAYWFDGSYPAYQGKVFSFGQTTISTAGLDFTQSGSYIFFFGINTVKGLVYDMLSVNVFPTGKTVMVTIFDSFQVVVFNKLSDGSIYGFSIGNDSRPIDPTRIKKVKEVSDRVGWTSDSVASTVYDGGIVTIPITANNDRAEWVLELSNGDFAWANPDWTAFAGKSATWNATVGLFEYGNYQKQTVTFSSGVAYIDFACNLTDGLVSYVNPNDIAEVRWNSDATGWNEFSSIRGTLQVNSQGNYFVKLTGLPLGTTSMTASQLFSVVLKNGSIVWSNIDKWVYSTSAKH